MKKIFKFSKINSKHRKGGALVFVILLFSIVMILSMSVLTVSNFSVNSAIRSEKQNKAYYLARAGAEAVKKAWEDSEVTESIRKPEGDVETIYVDANYDFLLTPSSNDRGIINISINPVTTNTEEIGLGAWEIISMAEVDGVKSEARLTSMGSTSIKELNEKEEYSNTNKRIIGLVNNKWKILDGTKNVEGTDSNIEMTRHSEIRGTLIVDVNEYDNGIENEASKVNKISFQEDDFKQKDFNPGIDYKSIAIIGQSIYFESPLELELVGYRTGFLGLGPYVNRSGALVISSETIVFNKPITMNYNIGRTDIGLLILHLPDGLGFLGKDIKNNVANEDDVDSDKRYGRVYFANDVIRNPETDGFYIGFWPFGTWVDHDTYKEGLSMRGFYFEGTDNGVIIGQDDNPNNLDLIPMKTPLGEDLNQIPRPDTNPVFFWN